MSNYFLSYTAEPVDYPVTQPNAWLVSQSESLSLFS